MPKSQTRGEKLAMQTIKIVSSQPPSDGERTEASPTRKSTRVRDNALLQSPVDTMSRKNNKVVGKQNEQRKKYIPPMQTDEDAELGERLLTPISTSSSSSTLPLVRSGSSSTTQLPQNKNGISNTPQADMSTLSSGKITTEETLPGHLSSLSKKKIVVPTNHDGLSEEIDDDSSDEITDEMKRKKRSRAALDDSFDHSDEENPHVINPPLHRGLTNNSPAINANDTARQRVTQSAGKKRSPSRKYRKSDYEDEDTKRYTYSSRSRASTPQVEINHGRIHGEQDPHLPYHEAAIGNIALHLYAKLATPRKKQMYPLSNIFEQL
jgi:hypothetical protein